MRRLLSTRRHIPLDRLDEYLGGWEALRSAVAAAGGNAWMFRGAEHQDQFIEFIEWRDEVGDPVPDGKEVRMALDNLDAAFGGHTDEWEEVPEA